VLVGLLATMLVAAPSGDRELLLEPKGRLRLSTGTEWDSNASRAVETGDDRDLTSDALLRLLIEADGELRWTSQDSLQVRYVLGAKRFFALQDEDYLVHDLSAYSRHRLGKWAHARAWGRWRQSRIRSGTRDYGLGQAGAALGVFFGAGVGAEVRGSYSAFEFPALPDFDSVGPTLGGELSWQATSRLRFAANVDHAWRDLAGNAFVRGREVMGNTVRITATLCDTPGLVSALSCIPTRREDSDLSFGLSAVYRGSFVLGGDAWASLTRSNSELENIDRYRLSLYATVQLPWASVLNGRGSVQVNQGVSGTATKNLAEDDENQNRLEIQFGRRIYEGLGAEIGYALYANAFATANASFLRQTVYVGLSYELDSSSP